MDALALTYEAPAACPTEDVLRAAVGARAPDAKGRADQAFTVRITGSGELEGRLTIVDRDEAAIRTLRAATCVELVNALALAIATALEPEEPASPPPPPLGAPPPPPPPPVVILRDGPPSAAPRARHFAAGAAAGVTSGLGPLAAPELALFAEYAWGVRAIRGGVAAGLGGAIPAGEAHGLLRRGVVRVEGCPLAWELGSFAPSLCAGAEVGFVAASGEGGPSPESVLRPWVAAGAAARGRLMVTGPLFLEVEARATFPFWHDQFFFRPSTDVYTIPAVALSTLAGAGLRFW